MTAEEVREARVHGYRPAELYHGDPRLKEAIDLIQSGFFSHGDKDLFRPLVDSLLHHDPYMLLADYASYVECQERVGRAYRDSDHWTRMSILNVARMGKFSSDRAIKEYCEEIWRVGPTKSGSGTNRSG
jgi:starch phosphorylase